MALDDIAGADFADGRQNSGSHALLADVMRTMEQKATGMAVTPLERTTGGRAADAPSSGGSQADASLQITKDNKGRIIHEQLPVMNNGQVVMRDVTFNWDPNNADATLPASVTIKDDSGTDELKVISLDENGNFVAQTKDNGEIFRFNVNGSLISLGNDINNQHIEAIQTRDGRMFQFVHDEGLGMDQLVETDVDGSVHKIVMGSDAEHFSGTLDGDVRIQYFDGSSDEYSGDGTVKRTDASGNTTVTRSPFAEGGGGPREFGADSQQVAEVKKFFADMGMTDVPLDHLIISQGDDGKLKVELDLTGGFDSTVNGNSVHLDQKITFDVDEKSANEIDIENIKGMNVTFHGVGVKELDMKHVDGQTSIDMALDGIITIHQTLNDPEQTFLDTAQLVDDGRHLFQS